MYCENCGALRQAGNAFCVSCGTSLGEAGRPQGGAQASFGYGTTSAVESQDNPLANPLAVRLATIACWLAFASAAFWLLTATIGYNRWWWACIPIVVVGALLLISGGDPRVALGIPIAASAIFYSSGFYYMEFLIQIPLALGSACLALAAIFLSKPRFSTPRANLVTVAALAGVFSLSSVMLSHYGNSFWSFEFVLFSDWWSLGEKLLTLIFSLAIVASLAIGCLLGGRATASVAIAGATYFGLLSVQTLLQDHSDLALGFYFGVLACGAFIATAVIASSMAKREMQPALLDPSLLAR